MADRPRGRRPDPVAHDHGSFGDHHCGCHHCGCHLFAGGTGGSSPSDFEPLPGGRAVFAAQNGAAGTELWVTNGTASGTTLLSDINAGLSSSSPARLTALGNGRAVFVATDAAAGSEPWVTDGTAAGTTRLADIAGGTANSSPG